MKIIRDGNDSALEGKVMICSKCSCVFAAYKYEYEKWHFDDRYEYRSKCPFCGYDVKLYEFIHEQEKP